MTYKLGSLSERYESGGRGPAAVSTGVADPGGVSYGTYQLASKTGTLADFLASEGKPWAAEFGKLIPGATPFSKTWQAIALREPDRFGEAQRAFIERSHYRPVVKAVKAATGLDLDARADAVRQAVWSCAVQHGGAARVLGDAVRSADRQAARSSTVYDRCLLSAIYSVRSAYVRKVAEGLTGREAATLRSIVENRYPDEYRRAVGMLA